MTTYTNLVKNPSMEVDLTGWTVSATGTMTRDTTKSVFGAASVAVKQNGTNTSVWIRYNDTNSQGIAVTPGNTYTLSYRASATSAGKGIYGNIYWHGAAGNSVGGSPATSITTSAANTWYTASASGVAPANAAYARIEFFYAGLGNNVDTAYVDGVLLSEGTFSNYFDGDSPYSSWTGTPHASTSTHTPPVFADPSDPSIRWDDFDDGVLGDLYTTTGIAPIIATGDGPGIVTTVDGRDGLATHYLQVGGTGDNRNDTVETSVQIGSGGGFVEFWRRAQSEQGWDYNKFFIDGVQQYSLTGTTADNTWTKVTYALAEGTHTLKWQYTSDSSSSSGISSQRIAVLTVTGLYVPVQAIVPGNHSLLEVDIAGTWTDITGPTKNISINRNDSDVGLMSAEVLDATLDPVTATTMRPGRKVRVSAWNGTDYSPIFTGAIDNVDVDYEPLAAEGKRVNVRISASDNVSYLANQAEPRGVGTIDELRWLVTGVPININGATTPLGSGTVISKNENASLWDNVLITRDSNLGYAWVGKDNVLNVFDSASMDTSIKAVIGPDVYRSLDVDFTLDQIINSVVVNWMRYNIGTETSAAVTYPAVQDAASIAEWGVREATFTVHGATEVEADIVAFANDVLARNATAEVRPRTAAVGIRDTGDLTYVNDVDLNSYVSVVYTDGVTTKTMRVTGINHTISADKWSTEFEFSLPSGVTAPSVTPNTNTNVIPPGSVTETELDPAVVTDIQTAQQQAQQALTDAEAAMNFAETRNKVYYQTTMPTGGTYSIGDTWYDTDDNKRIYVYNGTTFVDATSSYLIIPGGRLTVSPSGMYATDAGGNSTFGLSASTGAITMKGSLTSGSDITGATITASGSGVIQTEGTAARGIKMNSAGFTAYDGTGNPTFTITASTGAVAMKGTLQSGSTITGTNIYGSALITNTADSGARVKVYQSGAQGLLEFHSPAGLIGTIKAVDSAIDWLEITGAGAATYRIFPTGHYIEGGGVHFGSQNLDSINDLDVNGTLTADTIRPQTQPGIIDLGGTLNWVQMYGTLKSGTRSCSVAALNTDYNQAVTFATAFPSSAPVPTVTVSANVSNSHHVTTSITGITRSGFTIQYRRSAGATGAIDINWIAVAS